LTSKEGGRKPGEKEKGQSGAHAPRESGKEGGGRKGYSSLLTGKEGKGRRGIGGKREKDVVSPS